MAKFNPLKTGNTRVFIVEGRARPDHKPAYQSAMKAGGVSQGQGDVEKIEIPSDVEAGAFTEVASIKGQADRPTMTLTGIYASDLKSELLRLAKKRCAVDLHINIGTCTDPSDNNKYTKKMIIEDVSLTSFGTDDLGALSGDENAKVNETADVSGREVYEIVPVKWASRGGDIITTELLDAVICDTPSCGDCQTESSGCNKFFAITTAAGGSPGTSPDLVYSLDTGVTWYADDINSLATADAPDALDCFGSYIVVVSEAAQNLHYALQSVFDGTTLAADWTAVATGFRTDAGTGPRAIASAPSGRVAFIVGSGGFIYKMTDPTAGVTLVDAGVSFPLGTFNAVDAYSDEIAVAVGAAGIIAKTENGNTWEAVTTTPVGITVDINTVAVKSKTEWFIGCSNGNVYYTLNAGVTWTLKAFTGSGSGSVEDIAIANDSVMYMSHTTSGSLGRILRSINGGYDWVVCPEGLGSLAANDKINAIAACSHNPDIAFGVGLADDATDGFIVVGTD